MSFAQGHNALNAFVPVRLKLESLGLESSTLALSHCASGFSLQLSIYIWLTVRLYVLNKKKKAYTECSSANMHVHVCLYHSCHRIWKTEDQDPSKYIFFLFYTFYRLYAMSHPLKNAKKEKKKIANPNNFSTKNEYPHLMFSFANKNLWAFEVLKWNALSELKSQR